MMFDRIIKCNHKPAFEFAIMSHSFITRIANKGNVEVETLNHYNKCLKCDCLYHWKTEYKEQTNE